MASFNFVLKYSLFFSLWFTFSGFSLDLDDKIDYQTSKFRHYHVIKPLLENVKEKIKQDNVEKYADIDVIISFVLDNKNIILDLKRDEMIARNKIIIFQDNDKYLFNNQSENVGLSYSDRINVSCEFRGKLREDQSSWAFINTCFGIKGTIYYNKTIFHIEPKIANIADVQSDHYIYALAESTSNKICGHAVKTNVSDNTTRNRRSVPRTRKFISEPHNSNGKTLYNELVLVIDNSIYRNHKKNLQSVYNYCKDIISHVNFLYQELNIYIVLVGVVVWTQSDEIRIDSSSNTLKNFREFRKMKLNAQISHDNAHLLTNRKFTDGISGLASVGGICQSDTGGVSSVSNFIIEAASVLAHEMGHNFGMNHDNDGEYCNCKPNACVMNDVLHDPMPMHWSQCSVDVVNKYSKKIHYDCLRNKPSVIFGSPSCGNGFIEEGEECDCGPVPGVCAKCCNIKTCQLKQNATCATGTCCDKKACSVFEAGKLCRNAKQECDLPEYCTGSSEHCPQDLTKMDSEPCDGGNAFCFDGSCRSNTHSDQCVQIFGSNMKFEPYCYHEHNIQGDEYRNCGYEVISNTYKKCFDNDIFCGTLQCHSNVAIGTTNIPMAFSWISFFKTSRGYCYHVKSETKYKMVLNGASCGKDMMCVNQKCISVTTFRKHLKNKTSSVCPSNCSDHGVCNSEGQCHCDLGYGSSTCDIPGPGGAEGSGPASQPKRTFLIQVGFYTFFLGICPLAAIIILLVKCAPCYNVGRGQLYSSGYNENKVLSNVSFAPGNKLKSRNNNQKKSKIGINDTHKIVENASPAETNLINKLIMSQHKDSSTTKAILDRTFNCDFKTAIFAHKQGTLNPIDNTTIHMKQNIIMENSVYTKNMDIELNPNNDQTVLKGNIHQLTKISSATSNAASTRIRPKTHLNQKIPTENTVELAVFKKTSHSSEHRINRRDNVASINHDSIANLQEHQNLKVQRQEPGILDNNLLQHLEHSVVSSDTENTVNASTSVKNIIYTMNKSHIQNKTPSRTKEHPLKK